MTTRFGSSTSVPVESIRDLREWDPGLRHEREVLQRLLVAPDRERRRPRVGDLRDAVVAGTGAESLVTVDVNVTRSPGTTVGGLADAVDGDVDRAPWLNGFLNMVMDTQVARPTTQLPAWQLSPLVQALPSSQVVPLAFVGFEQAPARRIARSRRRGTDPAPCRSPSLRCSSRRGRRRPSCRRCRRCRSSRRSCWGSSKRPSPDRTFPRCGTGPAPCRSRWSRCRLRSGRRRPSCRRCRRCRSSRSRRSGSSRCPSTGCTSQPCGTGPAPCRSLPFRCSSRSDSCHRSCRRCRRCRSSRSR